MTEKGTTTRRPTVTKGRTNVGKGGVATAQRPAAAALKLKADAPVRGYGRGSDGNAFWYLNREGELAVVTAEPQNPALGITKIDIFPATAEQEVYNIVCKVRLTTLCGTDENITVFASDRTAGDIYMRSSGARKVEGKPATAEKGATEDKWYNDRKINNAAKAQILSYLHQFIEIK